jgi:hypothetical protein
LITDSNPIIPNNAQCPDYFYELINQTISLVTSDGNDQTSTDDNTDFCSQTSNYDVLTRVGPYPAIYYFGQSFFSSTVLTTFFTLFGVIGENGVPVSYTNLIILRLYFLVRIVDMN